MPKKREGKTLLGVFDIKTYVVARVTRQNRKGSKAWKALDLYLLLSVRQCINFFFWIDSLNEKRKSWRLKIELEKESKKREILSGFF